MNFLAHLYLSADDPEIQLGNFIGDFVRGRDLASRFPLGIVKGIFLHREIDEFTDRHAIVKLSKDRLRPKYRHYAPVIVDMFYDHLLAVNWEMYHQQKLPDFANGCYNYLVKSESILPEQVKWLLPHMVRGNWLVNYGKLEGIQQALSGMTRRSKFDSKMNEATHELQQFYNEFDQEFQLFFPLLKECATNFLSKY
ncbi:MAG: ACP phosphodiesterase [Cyclobacteriaceae bacterium]|nr:ACP phosphodiesterase [Cyclobacteriaceae bacterium]